MLNFNIDVNSPTQTGFVSDFSVAGNSSISEYFSQDSDMDLWIRPVVENVGNTFVPWVDDYVVGDVYYLSIGNVDDRPTGGTFTVAFLATSNPLAYNISAANLQTQLNAKSIDDGYGSLTVTMLVSGVYQVDWVDVGAVPAMTSNSSQLIPASQVLITQVRAGGASERAQQIIDLRQSPVATSTLTTAYVPTGVEVDLITTPSLTANAVYSVVFNDVYDGYLLLYITANGVESNVQVKPNMSEQEFGVALALHPQIFYQDAVEPDNISVKLVAGAYLITFIGTLAGSATLRTISAISVAAAAVVTTTAAHGYVSGDTVIISGSNSTPSVDGTRIITVLSATTFSVPVTTTGAGTAGTCYTTSQPLFQDTDDTNCITPKGLIGSLNLNTFALAKAFWNTTEDALTYSLQIKRTRASGEIKTIFGDDVTLKRELIDIGTLIDVPETGLLSLTLGRASVQNGELILANFADGDTVTIKVNNVTTPWTFTVPPNAGTAGQVMTTDGNGVTSWTTVLVSGGPLGTPSSGTLTNCTGLPIAGGGTSGTTPATARAALNCQQSCVMLDQDVTCASSSTAVVNVALAGTTFDGITVWGFPISVNAAVSFVYRFRVVDTPSPHNQRYGINVPSGAVGFAKLQSCGGGGSASYNFSGATDGTGSLINALATSGDDGFVTIEGSVINGSTAGNIVLMIGQGTSSATTFTIKKGGSLLFFK